MSLSSCLAYYASGSIHNTSPQNFRVSGGGYTGRWWNSARLREVIILLLAAFTTATAPISASVINGEKEEQNHGSCKLIAHDASDTNIILLRNTRWQGSPELREHQLQPRILITNQLKRGEHKSGCDCFDMSGAVFVDSYDCAHCT